MADVSRGAVPLRVLVVEDSQVDAELIALELRRSGYEPAYERVADREALRESLAGGTWDVLLSDHAMPGFSSGEVLALLQEIGSDVPCIIVSGAIGEEAAVSLLQCGAVDYVNKSRLGRLGPAIARALHETEMERARQESAAALKRAHEEAEAHLAQLRAIIESMTEGLVVVDPQARILTMNPAALRLYGYQRPEDAQQLVDRHLERLEVSELAGRPVGPGERPLERALRGEVFSGLEYRVHDRLRDVDWIARYSGTPVRDAGGRLALAVITVSDVTEKVRAQEAQRREELERLLTARSAEARRRIGRELHDGLRQQLIGMRMLSAKLHQALEARSVPEAEQMEEFSSLLGQANTQVRRLIHGLVPVSIDCDSLVPALERTAANNEQWYGVPCGVHLRGRLDIDDKAADHLFHITQEAVLNAAKHSGAERIEVFLDADGPAFMLEVCDDGGGLPDDFDKRGGMGLTNMRTRAELIGA
ncbi:MAG TPA: response regulator, partial [Trueperaceae bacterium]